MASSPVGLASQIAVTEMIASLVYAAVGLLPFRVATRWALPGTSTSPGVAASPGVSESGLSISAGAATVLLS